jgi:CubicO group peptidase (beta-lactamase class C family)
MEGNLDGILPRATPESVGIPSAAVVALVDELERSAHHVHSLMILRHGRVAAEGWWAPNRPDYPQMLFSLTKSFTSTAVGMAIAEGRFTLEDPVISFFPGKLPVEVGPNLGAMKVRHLLTMSAGHSAARVGSILRFLSEDWVRTFLRLPVEDEPGRTFVYSSAASHVLSAIVQETTGRKLAEFLRPRLFDPLGFGDVAWEEDPQGINTGGFGLMARTEEIAAFGLLYLQKGERQGRRLIDPAWVEAATSRQIATPPADGPDWEQGYGYQFWMSRNGYRGDGAFGQYCVVVPEHDLVVAVTSGVEKMARVLEPLWDLLLPALRPGPLAEDPTVRAAMERRLQGLHYDPRPGERSGRLESDLARSIFRVDRNRFDFETMRFEFGPEGGALAVTRSNGRPPSRLEFGRGTWRIGGSDLLSEWRGMPLAVSGSWAGPDEFEIDVNGPSTPFRYLFDFKADGSSLRLSIRVNLSFGLTSLGTVTARREAQG